MDKLNSVLIKHHKVFFVIVLFLSFGVASGVAFYYEKDEKVQAVNSQLEISIMPFVNNTKITIDGKTYVLNFISARLKTRRDYMVGQEAVAVYKIGLYESRVASGQLLDEIIFETVVSRDSYNSPFKVVCEERYENYSNFTKLLGDSYYEIITHEFKLWPKKTEVSYAEVKGINQAQLNSQYSTVFGEIILNSQYEYVPFGKPLQITIDVTKRIVNQNKWIYIVEDLLSFQ